MKLTNIDGIVKEFTTEKKFISYAQLIWDENETDENDANLERPFDFHTSVLYITGYTELLLNW